MGSSSTIKHSKCRKHLLRPLRLPHLVEKPLRLSIERAHQSRHVDATRTLTPHCHIVWVAAKRGNLFLDPGQPSLQVAERQVGNALRSANREMQRVLCYDLREAASKP